jgi:hypothetical protein
VRSSFALHLTLCIAKHKYRAGSYQKQGEDTKVG